MTSARTATVDTEPFGRVVIPEEVPDGAFLLWTTKDYEGVLTEQTRLALESLRETGGVSSLSSCHQVHGTRAIDVTRARAEWCEIEECDALWTRTKGVALAIKIADCLPVTLLSTDASFVANIHAGWRGAAAGIVTSTVGSSGIDPSHLSAWLGPAIRRCCFEVGEEVVQAFSDRMGEIEDLVSRDEEPGNNPRLDLPGLVARELERLGVPPHRIYDSELCTRCPESIFHSYRRSGADAGRNLAVAGLLDERGEEEG